MGSSAVLGAVLGPLVVVQPVTGGSETDRTPGSRPGSSGGRPARHR